MLSIGGSGGALIRTIGATNAAATVAFERSRYSGGQAAVADGDVLEQLAFAAFGGGSTAAVTAASITARVQQPSPTSSQMGGKITLATTASGGTAPANTWVLDNTGASTLGSGAVINIPSGGVMFGGSLRACVACSLRRCPPLCGR